MYAYINVSVFLLPYRILAAEPIPRIDHYSRHELKDFCQVILLTFRYNDVSDPDIHPRSYRQQRDSHMAVKKTGNIIYAYIYHMYLYAYKSSNENLPSLSTPDHPK